MGCCKDCKWWDTESDEHISLATGLTLDAVDIDGWGICQLTRTSLGALEHPQTHAAGVDGEGWRVALVTLPDFGCVQFERKE